MGFLDDMKKKVNKFVGAQTKALVPVKKKQSQPRVRRISPNTHKLDTVVVMPDQSEITLGQLIFMAGKYNELEKRHEKLETKFDNLNDKYHRIKNAVVGAAVSKGGQSLNDTQAAFLDYVKKKKLKKADFWVEIVKTKEVPVTSKASAYRVRNELLAAGLIELKDGHYVAVKEGGKQ